MLLLRPPVAGAYPACPWRAITGTDCPFCGGLRSVSALASGDVGAAMDYNLLVVVLVPLVLLVAAGSLLLGRRAEPLLSWLASPPALRSFGVVVGAWFVLRLLPVAPWLGSST